MKYLKRIFENKKDETNFDSQAEEIEDYFMEMIDDGECVMLKKGFKVDSSFGISSHDTVLFKVSVEGLEDLSSDIDEINRISDETIKKLSRVKLIINKLNKNGYKCGFMIKNESINVFVKIKSISATKSKVFKIQGSSILIDAVKICDYFSSFGDIYYLEIQDDGAGFDIKFIGDDISDAIYEFTKELFNQDDKIKFDFDAEYQNWDGEDTTVFSITINSSEDEDMGIFFSEHPGDESFTQYWAEDEEYQ